ncbi:MAG: heterodisulfide reductase-related iron-sulfur binding cluster, partial [Methanimicrococcus sp.]|nr:heterodisulfide reductase-related iron-sulfur binding cluster [Methanimicrococcus sp.]
GVGNAGVGNAGVGNAGVGNAGVGNAGVGNAGVGNAGVGNAGVGNAGVGNAGVGNAGVGNAGVGNAGVGNAGVGNAGVGNAGVGKLKLYYQDPCHLTRALGIYEDPRRVIAAIPGIELVNPTQDGSICCGFGGGVRAAFPQKSLGMAERVHQFAKSMGSGAIITNCGGCMKNIIESGYTSAEGLPVYDLAEFVSIACGNAPVERDDMKLIYLSNKALLKCLTKYDYEPYGDLAPVYDPDLK